MPMPPPIFAFFQNLQGWELLLIFFVILLLFGGKRLPELAKGLGRSIREFRKATTEVEESVREALDAEDKTPIQPPPTAIKAEKTTTTDT